MWVRRSRRWTERYFRPQTLRVRMRILLAGWRAGDGGWEDWGGCSWSCSWSCSGGGCGVKLIDMVAGSSISKDGDRSVCRCRPAAAERCKDQMAKSSAVDGER